MPRGPRQDARGSVRCRDSERDGGHVPSYRRPSPEGRRGTENRKQARPLTQKEGPDPMGTETGARPRGVVPSAARLRPHRLVGHVMGMCSAVPGTSALGRQRKVLSGHESPSGGREAVLRPRTAQWGAAGRCPRWPPASDAASQQPPPRGDPPPLRLAEEMARAHARGAT